MVQLSLRMAFDRKKQSLNHKKLDDFLYVYCSPTLRTRCADVIATVTLRLVIFVNLIDDELVGYDITEKLIQCKNYSCSNPLCSHPTKLLFLIDPSLSLQTAVRILLCGMGYLCIEQAGSMPVFGRVAALHALPFGVAGDSLMDLTMAASRMTALPMMNPRSSSIIIGLKASSMNKQFRDDGSRLWQRGKPFLTAFWPAFDVKQVYFSSQLSPIILETLCLIDG